MDQVERIEVAVLRSRKYRDVARPLVRAIAETELSKGRSVKKAIKATKTQLHQSAAAYQVPARMQYDRWLAKIDAVCRAPSGPVDAPVRSVLLSVMENHASTQERLSILAEFYRKVFERLPPVHSVLDIGCGLNPLAYPWMPLAEDARYLACDIFADQVRFLNRFFDMAGIDGRAEVRDVLQDCPPDRVDLALVLKTIPCLEQIETRSGRRLLDELDARYVLVSFPVQSLGGRSKGMASTYSKQMDELVAGRNWPVERVPVEGELAFVVQKG